MNKKIFFFHADTLSLILTNKMKSCQLFLKVHLLVNSSHLQMYQTFAIHPNSEF